ncbi:hypothetical protein LJB98_00060 [Bacteroidales bacterium OttesenSCG-928-M11]|nr:hypothetical protein [Bacteroidales bacterium OttesenSCG-928-M11]
MTKKSSQLDQISRENPFKVPEGYFEGLSTQILSNLPEREEETKVVSLWERIKPWTYMAAMFIGIALMVKVFVGTSPEKSSGNILNLSSSADIEEFYNYYEEQSIRNEYRETIYSDSFTTEEEKEENYNYF